MQISANKKMRGEAGARRSIRPLAMCCAPLAVALHAAVAFATEPDGTPLWPLPGQYSLGHTGNLR